MLITFSLLLKAYFWCAQLFLFRPLLQWKINISHGVATICCFHINFDGIHDLIERLQVCILSELSPEVGRNAWNT